MLTEEDRIRRRELEAEHSRTRLEAARSGRDVAAATEHVATTKRQRAQATEDVEQARTKRSRMTEINPVTEYLRKSWWDAGARTPDDDIAQDSTVRRRTDRNAKLHARANALPSWAKLGASNDTFDTGLKRVGSQEDLADIRSGLTAYTEQATPQETGTHEFSQASRRIAEVDKATAMLEDDERQRSRLGALAAVQKLTPAKRHLEIVPRKGKRRTTSHTRKAKKAKTKSKVVQVFTDPPTGTGFDSRFFV